MHHMCVVCNENNRPVSTAHIKEHSNDKMNPVIVCIQAWHGKRLEYRPPAEQLSVYLRVCLSDLCVKQRSLLCGETASKNPLPSPSLSLHRPTVSFTQQVSDYTRVRLVLRPPSFRESDHALSNYWYQYRYSVSVSKKDKCIGIGSIGKLWYRSHPK